MRLSNIASTFKKCRQEHRPALLTYTVKMQARTQTSTFNLYSFRRP